MLQEIRQFINLVIYYALLQGLVNSLFVISEPAKICNVTGYIGVVIDPAGTSGPFRREYHDSYAGSSAGWTKSGAHMDLSQATSLFTNDTDSVNPESVTCKFAIKY